MSKSSPFDWLAEQAQHARAQLDAVFQNNASTSSPIAAMLEPPMWLLQEVQQRMVLFLNHVLMQEQAARDRLQRQKGRLVQINWRDQSFRCRFTPAGLLELDTLSSQKPDLILRATQDSPLDIAKSVMQGHKPAIHIEGDVQLAAEVNWLFDHVRWEPEEDLSRLIGDAAAHTVVSNARKVLQALREFVQSRQKVAPL